MKLLALLGLPALALLGLTTGTPEPVAAPSAADTYQVDPVHSSVVFRVKHVGASWFYGRFNEVSGTFVVDEANPGNASIEVEIKAASVDTRGEQRDAHVKSPDFLSAKEFPSISFKSTEVKATGDGLEVTGELTFRGVTKSVTAPVEHVGEGEFQGSERSGYEAVLEIKRSDYGSDYGVSQGVLGDEVRLIIALEGVKQ